jgi:hypothetical protein
MRVCTPGTTISKRAAKVRRLWTGSSDVVETICAVDDMADSYGQTVLRYSQALTKIREVFLRGNAPQSAVVSFAAIRRGRLVANVS